MILSMCIARGKAAVNFNCLGLTCSDIVCQNNGTCHNSSYNYGAYCSCQPGFVYEDCSGIFN